MAPDFSAQDAARARARSARRACSSTATSTCAKRPSARTRPATSAPAARSCSGRSSAEQMRKLLATKKTDLLQFVSSRTRRPFSAFLVVQKDGKIGFEFEAKDPDQGARPRRAAATALRVLGAHPKTRAPVELHSGRYGPYVKHGAVNATIARPRPGRHADARRRAGAARREDRQARARAAPRGPPPSRPRARRRRPPRRRPRRSRRRHEDRDGEDRGQARGEGCQVARKAATTKPRQAPRRRPPSPRRASRRHS